MAEYEITFKDIITDEGKEAVELLTEANKTQEFTDAGMFAIAVIDLFNKGELANSVKEIIIALQERQDEHDG